MSSTTDQIERMAKEIMVLKFSDELKECASLEDFEKIRKKYEKLAKEIQTP